MAGPDISKYAPNYDRGLVRGLKQELAQLRARVTLIDGDKSIKWQDRDKLKQPLVDAIGQIYQKLEVIAGIQCETCGKMSPFSGNMWATLDFAHVWCKTHVPEDILVIEVKSQIGPNDVPVPDDGGRGCIYFHLGEVHMWAEPNAYGVCGQSIRCGWYIYPCWVNNGSTSWPLTDDEKARCARGDILGVMQEIAEKRKVGIIRCTGCGKELTPSEVAGRPLFAGCNCTKCWEQHKAKVKEERRTGKVCSMCGKPYSQCYC